MVRLAGFEPAAYGLEVRCSIQLSYRRTHKNFRYHMFAYMSIEMQASIQSYLNKAQVFVDLIDLDISDEKKAE